MPKCSAESQSPQQQQVTSLEPRRHDLCHELQELHFLPLEEALGSLAWWLVILPVAGGGLKLDDL